MLDTAPDAKPSSVMSDEELVTHLEDMNRRAVGYLSDEVSVDQDDNLERYLGRPYGDEEEGRSTAMSMDVAEVVDWALPDLLEPFVAGDKIVEFTPNNEGDEAFCDQATDLVQHVFMTENPGFLILHDMVKTALIQKLGVIKTVWRDEDKVEEQTLTGLSLIQLQELQKDSEIEIGELTPEQAPPETQMAFPDGHVYTVQITRTVKDGCVSVMSIPPEEFKVSQRAPALDQKIEYVAHESEKNRGALVDMGFDNDVVAGLSADKRRDSDRQDARFQGEERREDSGSKKAGDILTLVEEYPLLDLKGDGRLRRYQVFRVGKTLLEDPAEVTEHPFDCWTADRIPHRLIGLALADKVKQTQKIKTHLTRNFLDNVYLANNPRMEVPEQAMTGNGETIADLLQYRIGGLIRTKQPGMLHPIEIPDRSASALQAIVYMDGVREQQSGVVKNGMAVSSEEIDPKSATEARKDDRNEQVRKKLMCRMIAETCLVPVFRKILRNLVKYQDQPKWLKINRKWVAMDPRAWNADMKAKASTGLGYSNRDEQTNAAMAILNVQKEAMAAGLVTLVSPKKIFKAAEKLVQAVGFKHADEFFIDPDSDEGKQAQQQAEQNQGQDPKMVEAQTKAQVAQMQAQLDQGKAQHAAQLKEAEAQSRMREAQIKAENDKQIAILKANSEAQIAQMRISAEMQQAAAQTKAEMDLAYWQAEQESELARDQMHLDHSVQKQKASDDASIKKVRFGGKIG